MNKNSLDYKLRPWATKVFEYERGHIKRRGFNVSCLQTFSTHLKLTNKYLYI